MNRNDNLSRYETMHFRIRASAQADLDTVLIAITDHLKSREVMNIVSTIHATYIEYDCFRATATATSQLGVRVNLDAPTNNSPNRVQDEMVIEVYRKSHDGYESGEVFKKLRNIFFEMQLLIDPNYVLRPSPNPADFADFDFGEMSMEIESPAQSARNQFRHMIQSMEGRAVMSIHDVTHVAGLVQFEQDRFVEKHPDLGDISMLDVFVRHVVEIEINGAINGPEDLTTTMHVLIALRYIARNPALDHYLGLHWETLENAWNKLFPLSTSSWADMSVPVSDAIIK